MPSASSYERLTQSRAGTAAKEVVRRHAPRAADRVQRAIRAARRALSEPALAQFGANQQLWHPPPRRPRRWSTVAGPVSDVLFARLSEADVQLMLERLDDRDRAVWDEAGESERRLLAVQFCVHYAVHGVPERTGLSAAAPPPQVTTMGQGSLAAAGSLYYADLVVDFLRGAGIDVPSQQRVLDFGCSSGRVLRVLAAVYPTIEWSGCDPDTGAVEWAGANFPDVSFFVSGVEPPLPYPADHLDLVYAISIWTHYSEPAAIRWLKEMRRVVKVGGHLLLTAHGYRAVEVRDGEWADWPPDLIAETATRLYSDGFKFHGGYGKDLSLALSTPDWGESFFTPEWLADQACPEWAILDFAPGRVENHHDLYLLERRT